MRSRRVYWLLLILAACGAVGFVVSRKREPAAPVRVSRPAPPKPLPSAIVDPVLPGRPLSLDSARAALDPNWVKAPPHGRFQYSRPASERGGVEPCATPIPSAAKSVVPLSRGTLLTGGKSPLAEDGSFDLIVHLHGEAPVRRELVESGQPFVLFTLTLPGNETYAPLFAGSGYFGQLIDAITAAVSKRHGVTARARHVALSAWSAGFEGVRSILYQPEAERIEAVILIDGLHAPRGPKGLTTNMESFLGFARRAERRESWFAITHSSIPTGPYSSTTESAHFLINELGGRPTAVKREDDFGLELVEFFSSGNFHVRGYAGNDKADHCAQLFLLRSLFTALHKHFHP